MKVLVVLGSALMCAALAGAAASFVCERYVRWFHVQQAAYLVAAVVLMGTGAGFVAGLLSGALAPGLLVALAADGAVVLAVAGPVLGFLYVRGDVPPQDRGEHLDLAIQVRGPEGLRLTNGMKANGGFATLRRIRQDGQEGHSSYTSGPWRSGEQGRWVASLWLGVFSSKGPWKIEFQASDKTRIRFSDLHPGPMRAGAEWSSWIDSPQGYSLRYRLVRTSEARQMQASMEAAEKVAREMPLPGAPVEDWVQFYGSPACTGDRQLEVLGIIRSRHDEVARLLQDAKPGALQVPLRAVSVYYQMPRSFEGPLRGFLRPLTEAVLEYRRNSPAADPDILAAQALRENFTRWASAWDVLLTCYPNVAEPDLQPLIDAAAGAGENDPVHEIARSASSYRDHALRN